MSEISNELATIAVPGTDAAIMATLVDGKPFVALKPMCEALGIDVDSQRKKLNAKSWACTVLSTAHDTTGREQQMFMIDRRTMTMWLATIDENRVGPESAPAVRAFQSEAADALDAYFNEGGAINPRATESQLDRISATAKAQAELIRAFEGLIDPKHLEAKARVVLARGLGELPEVNPADRPLYVWDFLKEKGVKYSLLDSTGKSFGTKMKNAFVREYGVPPMKAPQNMPDGKVRSTNAYTESDRPLMERVWAEY